MLGEAGWGGWGLGGSSLSPKLNYLHVSITMPYHEHAMIYAVNSTCHRCSKNTQPLWIYPNMFIEFYSLLQVEFYDCVQWVQFDKGKVYIGPPSPPDKWFPVCNIFQERFNKRQPLGHEHADSVQVGGWSSRHNSLHISYLILSNIDQELTFMFSFLPRHIFLPQTMYKKTPAADCDS